VLQLGRIDIIRDGVGSDRVPAGYVRWRADYDVNKTSDGRWRVTVTDKRPLPAVPK
jgi:hypothetical protein